MTLTIPKCYGEPNIKTHDKTNGLEIMLGHGITWSVTTVKVSDLIPFDKNPRKHTKEDLERLKRSIVEIGFHTPILATLKNEIMGGHLRIKALKELGIEEVFVSKPNIELSEDEFKRALIESNTHHGEWDLEIIEQEFHGVDLIELGMDDNLVSAVRKAESKSGLIADDESPEPPTIPVSASGDVWLLGAHRVMCGSSERIG